MNDHRPAIFDGFKAVFETGELLLKFNEQVGVGTRLLKFADAVS